MDYVIIVNDNGELKTISATEHGAFSHGASAHLERDINAILDERSAAEEAAARGVAEEASVAAGRKRFDRADRG